MQTLNFFDDTRLKIGFFRSEVRRRQSGMGHVMCQIERNLCMLAASPLLSADARFHNLIYRISLAGSAEDFVDRFADMHQYVLAIANQSAKAEVFGDRLVRSGRVVASICPGSGEAGGGRRLLRL